MRSLVVAIVGLLAAVSSPSSGAADGVTVRVTEQPAVSQPGPFSNRGRTVVVPRTQIDIDGVPGGGPAAVPAGTVITGKVREVADAGTLEVGGQRLRLYGIDAPAVGATCKAGGQYWSCGQNAAFALAYETAEHWLSCETKGRDADGTLLAVCRAGPNDLGAVMVRQGWALADRQASPGYAIEEAAARAAQAGLWRGGFLPPRR